MVLPIFDLIPELFADKYPELLGSHASIRDYTECAEVILCISEETKQDLLICWPNLASKNIVVSEPLFELPSAEVFLAATSQKPRTKSKLLNLIHVGERFYYKNFVEVAHAVINAKTKTSLRVLGGGIPSAAEIKLAELARENGNSIKFLGSVNQKELDSEYKNADFTVIGSEKEGFGYAFVESLTRGTPVIAKAPNMWSNIPLVLSQESLNFDSDYILGFREDSMNHLELLSLWEVLNYKILNSINTFNSLKSQL
jgi:hypothetical protein